MTPSNRIAVSAACVFAVCVGFAIGAGSAAAEPDLPSWLVAGNPEDETIRYFWERAALGELDADSLVDLGTLIFDRGHPDEAIGFYKQALKVDSGMYEAWFRIGLVEHTRGDLNNAEQAYSRCLKKRPGHAWCNFYYGRLEEQLGHPVKAMEHYEAAFREAPRLADPAFNPEILSSRLSLGAWLRQYDARRFEEEIPMRLLRPDEVNAVRRTFEAAPAGEPAPAVEAAAETESETRTGTEKAAEVAAPAAQATPVAAAPAPAPPPAPPARRVPTRPPATPESSGGSTGASAGETPYGAPMTPISNTSGEAHLRPAWARLFGWSEVLV
jgi:tetratricopeptide (TPR) repeat protein